ncbi:MAG: hypothetical protein HQK49_00260 [Oligoflexia bacterium]|nr:hypothetical protein [Oligoflexia bacterium]
MKLFLCLFLFLPSFCLTNLQARDIPDDNQRTGSEQEKAKMKTKEFLKYLTQTQTQKDTVAVKRSLIDEVDLALLYRSFDFKNGELENFFEQKTKMISFTNDLPNEHIEKFISSIFQKITKEFKDININQTDLNHGHLKKTAEGDWVIIFHSAECPTDLGRLAAAGCNGQVAGMYGNLDSKYNSHQNKNINDLSVKSKKRNLIWSLHRQKIWRIDTSEELNFTTYNEESASLVGFIREDLQKIFKGIPDDPKIMSNQILYQKVSNTFNESFAGEGKISIGCKRIDENNHRIWFYQ